MYKDILKSYLDVTEENFLCLTFNNAQEVIRLHELTHGTQNRSAVLPRDVFLMALDDNAAAIIVAHNHPSGNVTPSEADWKLTERLQKTGKFLGLPVLDHIIFSSKDYYSFVENGKMNFS